LITVYSRSFRDFVVSLALIWQTLPASDTIQQHRPRQSD
jgi:hypothetical protein